MPQATTLPLPDVNALLAGFRTSHVHHRPVRAFLEDARSQTATLAISDVRIDVTRTPCDESTRVRAAGHRDAVLDYIDALLDLPAELITAGASHWPRFAGLCRALNLRGNLVPDAYLAALALEQRVTFDRGFGRYPRLSWRCLLDD